MRRKSEFDYRRDAKVLIYDLEVSGMLMWAYGYYEPKVVKIVQTPKLLSIAWKWLGDDKVECETIADYNNLNENDDTLLINKLWKLLDECEIAVAYNGDRFDNKVANTFFVERNLEPPSPYKTFDPLKTAKRFFRFDCNKLDYVGKLLAGIGKTEQTYGDCWDDLMFGNKKERSSASKLMKAYNKQDVIVLEKVYQKLLPWATNHPNMALASGKDVCPRCGWNEGFLISKYRYTGTQINAIQYQCKHCGGYVTKRLDKEERDQLAEEGRLKSTFRNLSA